MQSIDYYNQYADEFTEATLYLDMASLYQPFLSVLPKGTRILDVGCGSGRDTLAFKNKGYEVDAIDYSVELVKRATQLTGVPVQLMSFYEIDEHGIYDGVWACASLLHCERSRLAEVVARLIGALKTNGTLYMSFKYGKSDRKKDGRAFTDLEEAQSKALLQLFNNVEQIQQWITVDQRPDRQEKWLNLLWKKHG